MTSAVFLDRDGVLNDMVLNPATGAYEPPRSVDELVLYQGVIDSLRCLVNSGFLLFLVSNQPDYAKGKMRLEDIHAVHDHFDKILKEQRITFCDYYYCYHHPDGVVPGYSYPCECRKPKPYFIFKARDEFHIDLASSWMVGDRDTDIECGKSAGLKTILIKNEKSQQYQSAGREDFRAANLKIAVQIIICQSNAAQTGA